jgi:hypothetical protein
LSEGTEEICETRHLGQPVSRPRFEPVTSRKEGNVSACGNSLAALGKGRAKRLVLNFTLKPPYPKEKNTRFLFSESGGFDEMLSKGWLLYFHSTISLWRCA